MNELLQISEVFHEGSRRWRHEYRITRPSPADPVLTGSELSRHLMLSAEVVADVEAGCFHVWSARTIDEGIELLCGIPAGQRGEHGRFPPGSVHARVEDRLERWASDEQPRAERARADADAEDLQADPAPPTAPGMGSAAPGRLACDVPRSA